MASAASRDSSAAPINSNLPVIPRNVEDHPISKIPHILPHERVFPIQVGGEVFKLSGASLSSDAPSYFSQFFLCQIKKAQANGEDPCSNLNTLYIDRDPETFRDIALHLRGYHVSPRDATHFVRLFADAQFYTLPKLISRLYEESVFISIGHREFQIPRDLFSDPGNSPNYFSLGFGAFFSRPDELFPGLDHDGLIRPPSILPPSVPNRDADIFAELLRLLRGYPVIIRDEVHRAHLLRDARYFHFKGLEQRLIAHSISYNQSRGRDEITLKLENIQKSGITIAPDRDNNGDNNTSEFTSAWINYARPFVDEQSAELVLEIGGESTKIHFNHDKDSSSGGDGSGVSISSGAEFFKDTKARMARLFEVIATKLNLPPTTQPLGLLMAQGGAGSTPPTPGNTPLSGEYVRVIVPPEASIVLDGEDYHGHGSSSTVGGDQGTEDIAGSRKRRRTDGSVAEDSETWVIRRGLWRLRIQPSKGGKSAVECALVAVKLDAFSSESGRNTKREFLGS